MNKPQANAATLAQDSYSLDQTRVETAGVTRCCLWDVAAEYDGKPVKLGYKSVCPHCKTTFTLVWHTAQSGKSYPLWKPDWQIAGNNGSPKP